MWWIFRVGILFIDCFVLEQKHSYFRFWMNYLIIKNINCTKYHKSNIIVCSCKNKLISKIEFDHIKPWPCIRLCSIFHQKQFFWFSVFKATLIIGFAQTDHVLTINKSYSETYAWLNFFLGVKVCNVHRLETNLVFKTMQSLPIFMV